MSESDKVIRFHEGDLVLFEDRPYVVVTTPPADGGQISVLPADVFSVSCQACPSYLPFTVLPRDRLQLEQASHIGREELERFFRSGRRMRHPEP